MNGSYLQGAKEAYLQNFQDELVSLSDEELEMVRMENGPHGWIDFFRFLYSNRNLRDVVIMREEFRRRRE